MAESKKMYLKHHEDSPYRKKNIRAAEKRIIDPSYYQARLPQRNYDLSHRKYEYGTISAPSFAQRHPIVAGINEGLRDVSGISTSQRIASNLWGPKSPWSPSVMSRPVSAPQYIDWLGRSSSSVAEMGLVASDLGAVAGKVNPAVLLDNLIRPVMDAARRKKKRNLLKLRKK